jgi:hypothetical protein
VNGRGGSVTRKPAGLEECSHALADPRRVGVSRRDCPRGASDRRPANHGAGGRARVHPAEDRHQVEGVDSGSWGPDSPPPRCTRLEPVIYLPRSATGRLLPALGDDRLQSFPTSLRDHSRAACSLPDPSRKSGLRSQVLPEGIARHRADAVQCALSRLLSHDGNFLTQLPWGPFLVLQTVGAMVGCTCPNTTSPCSTVWRRSRTSSYSAPAGTCAPGLAARPWSSVGG